MVRQTFRWPGRQCCPDQLNVSYVLIHPQFHFFDLPLVLQGDSKAASKHIDLAGILPALHFLWQGADESPDEG